MTDLPVDARVCFDTHPVHVSAVIATITGPQAHIAHQALEAEGWSVVAENTLVLARIDHEEPYWAELTAVYLVSEGVTVEITPRLKDAMDEGWDWTGYPMPWLDRSEIREVSDQAQQIHDDIRDGRLLVHAHAHAHDDHTTVAVATYIDTGKSVHLHGEDHLRQITSTFGSPAKALLAFENHHGTMCPGPAPTTDAERAAAEARTAAPSSEHPVPARPESVTVPAYAADAGDHDALLDTFLNTHRDWQKWRTWSDETTHAIHESQTLRIERIHEADARETAWTVAAYETPVSDRMWVLTATGSTPAPVVQELLDHLAYTDGGDTAIGNPVDEKSVTAATQPLTDAGWNHTVDGRWIRWTSPSGDAGVQFDAFAAQRPNQNLATWTVWAGPDPNRGTWTITASPYTPSALLADLSENLAHATATRQLQPGKTTSPKLPTSFFPRSPASHRL
ncbi:DUF317 domain-containing protein [Streptomyces sp. CAS3]